MISQYSFESWGHFNPIHSFDCLYSIYLLHSSDFLRLPFLSLLLWHPVLPPLPFLSLLLWHPVLPSITSLHGLPDTFIFLLTPLTFYIHFNPFIPSGHSSSITLSLLLRLPMRPSLPLLPVFSLSLHCLDSFSSHYSLHSLDSLPSCRSLVSFDFLYHLYPSLPLLAVLLLPSLLCVFPVLYLFLFTAAVSYDFSVSLYFLHSFNSLTSLASSK